MIVRASQIYCYCGFRNSVEYKKCAMCVPSISIKQQYQKNKTLRLPDVKNYNAPYSAAMYSNASSTCTSLKNLIDAFAELRLTQEIRYRPILESNPWDPWEKLSFVMDRCVGWNLLAEVLEPPDAFAAALSNLFLDPEAAAAPEFTPPTPPRFVSRCCWYRWPLLSSPLDPPTYWMLELAWHCHTLSQVRYSGTRL